MAKFQNIQQTLPAYKVVQNVCSVRLHKNQILEEVRQERKSFQKIPSKIKSLSSQMRYVKGVSVDIRR